jgi:hypothetical protein
MYTPFPSYSGEFLDNSIQATKHVLARDIKPEITLHFVADEDHDFPGYIIVDDNGSGMDMKDLGKLLQHGRTADAMKVDSANTVEGASSADPTARGPPYNQGATAFLGKYGVGLKNAAFWLGNDILIITKKGRGNKVVEIRGNKDKMAARQDRGETNDLEFETLEGRDAGDFNESLLTKPEQDMFESYMSERERTLDSFTTVLVGGVSRDIMDKLVNIPKNCMNADAAGQIADT